jgi:tRNA 2-thiouridine synthesizing protein E
MKTIQFMGKKIECDDNGYLVNSDDWTHELAVHLANEDGFKGLGEDKKHWIVIELLRNLHQKDMLPRGDGEILFMLTKGTGLSLAKLHRLFSGLSLAKLVRWAGLPALACPAGV